MNSLDCIIYDLHHRCLKAIFSAFPERLINSTSLKVDEALASKGLGASLDILPMVEFYRSRLHDFNPRH